MFDKRRSRAIFRSNAENPSETFDFSQLDQHFRAISQSTSTSCGIPDQQVAANASRCYPVRQETLPPPNDTSDINTQKCSISAKIDHTQEKRMANINISSLYDSRDYDNEFSTSSSCYSPTVATIVHRSNGSTQRSPLIQQNVERLVRSDASYSSPGSSDYAEGASDVAVVDDDDEEDYDDPFHDFEEYDDDDECVYGDFEYKYSLIMT
ncbi:hypothetical protein FDP41_004353 [Naegleria fowleri]|uniref:Uncharacterized protein n=1 Tax=Naegleria fowleri TaxID=5763 RepID=A0A6A5BQN0_NAEFO|nr:uncharacterized protein FDP41_004963 [Naegleria fowleri]XP_044561167.1 uncharacterized protein FDP41_004353 [Naegleria fowleri]KAF0975997.1 hypothetical protein FDP41_004963 [Naegleria fowleri]KAF0976454.1 hypothetical protein FDP41_004353 [Naegleria fowleri]